MDANIDLIFFKRFALDISHLSKILLTNCFLSYFHIEAVLLNETFNCVLALYLCKLSMLYARALHSLFDNQHSGIIYMSAQMPSNLQREQLLHARLPFGLYAQTQTGAPSHANGCPLCKRGGRGDLFAEHESINRERTRADLVSPYGSRRKECLSCG